MDLKKLIGEKSPEIAHEELEYLKERSRKLAELEKKEVEEQALEQAFAKLLSLTTSDRFLNQLNQLGQERIEAFKALDEQYNRKFVGLFESNPEFKNFYVLLSRLNPDLPNLPDLN